MFYLYYVLYTLKQRNTLSSTCMILSQRKAGNRMSDGETKYMEVDEEGGEQLVPFMDTFYSLASNDAHERSFAAASMIRHLFFKEETGQASIAETVKDGSYALTRLFNGLCSGRASARQGFASCLTSFIKVSFSKAPGDNADKIWMDLFMDNMGQPSEMNAADFVRNKLRECTNLEGPVKGKKSAGKKSRAEERDNRFGRLFGILAIVRSGTLTDASEQVLEDYVSDLVSLYDHKNWFREPAVHALREVFSFVSASCSMDALDKLVQRTMAKFFNFENKVSCPWSAEKIALYLYLQTIYMDCSGMELPKCLKNALLTKSNLDSDIGGGVMKIMLRDTSATVYPKRHLVWNSIWSYVSKQADSSTDRVLREELIAGDNTTSDIIVALVNKVIVESLLGDEGADKSFVNATPGRRALALSLLQQLCALNLPSHILEEVVLQKPIITNLFVNTLQKFSGGIKTHTLKPLAIDILKSIVHSLCSRGFTEENAQRRIGASKAFLKANQSFDSVTKTETVSLLLGLDMDEGSKDDDLNESGRKLLWEYHFQFVMDEILNLLSSDEPAIQEAKKFMDVMFAFVKRILRVGNDDEKKSLFRRTSSFFMVGAFFDLQCFNNSEVDIGSSSHVLNAACRIKDSVERIPYDSRVTMSSRFFSLLSDYIHTMTFQQSDEVRENTKDKKVHIVQEEVSRINAEIRIMQDHSAALFSATNTNSDENINDEGVSVSLGSMEAFNAIKDLDVEKGDHARTVTRAINAIACLVSSLSLQLLHPGHPESDNETEDGLHEEDDYSEDILETIDDLSDVASALAGNQPSDKDVDTEERDNFLSPLAAICVNVLRSPIGGSGLQASNVRGGASKIVRDCLQIAWTATLASAATITDDLLDVEVMSILLEAVCTPKALAQGENMLDDEEMDELDEVDQDSDGENDDTALSFSNVADTGNDSDSDHSSNDDDNDMTNDRSHEGDDEIELDSSKLENLLIQSSDDDESVALEHHAGADAALVHLIKMKQEARKSGKEQKEKVELADRVRCLGLLEAVFQSNKRTTLLSNQVTLMAILPLLRTRSELVKSAGSVIIQKKGSSANDKKVLLDKITIFLVNQVCKTNLDGKANVEACSTVAEQVLVEVRRVQDTSHSKCCGSLLVLLVKACMDHGEEAIAMARSIYEDAIQEWSSKKSTKIQATIFDDLEKRCHSVATSVLTNPLVKASKEARNSFLKCECFRILSSLYLVQPSDDASADVGVAALKMAAIPLSSSLVEALKDEEMLKAKRVRDILKTAERLVKFANIHGDNNIWSGLTELQVVIVSLVKCSESSAVQNLCKKLDRDIDEGVKLQAKKKAEEEATKLKSPPSSKKRKKKSSKKKKK